MFIPGNRSSVGFPSPADDYIERTLDLNELLIKNKIATFFMRADGDGLKDSGINHGDLLIVDRSLPPAAGKTVVAVIDGELLLRKIEKHEGRLVLVSSEESAEPVVFDGEEIQVWGVITSVVHQL
ncbi:MAG: translesion error-prone DNA polymerase V autoproteolytic subunit [Cyanobacteria bacterium SZAS LIN-2]|nr:translesion error-prone DNA polymerase V autoproteolytic subunit [Cyanobacteria bacterium SZAS LIN-3]MBS1996657.1 translesion error-prone DNA polymerase V autoproteolytic subunit [Cyanobacteria bacterium SZAS LIN-2]MBS2007486.1 translesion error-prone DNA polymerase V autoproteolytic subunit [Cyanobacteria bacterium SZAS TMP-1]